MRYRVRFCCATCRKWDVVRDGFLIDRFDTWQQAYDCARAAACYEHMALWSAELAGKLAGKVLFG